MQHGWSNELNNMNIKKIYSQVNDITKRDFPQKALHEVISEQAQKTPDAIAVLSGEQTLTYRQLDERSNQLANFLRGQNVGRGDLVGLCCNRDVDTPALLVGIMKSGAAYVPLDPDYPVDRLAYMVENSEVKHVIAHLDQADLVADFSVPGMSSLQLVVSQSKRESNLKLTSPM